MPLTYVPLSAETAARYRAGGPDAHGQPPERSVSDGSGNPCRRCLRDIPKGAGMLILAHRPFASLQPYAEAGPIFMCADDCHPPGDAGALPETTKARTQVLVKGYLATDRIHYGTGRIVAPEALEAACGTLLADPRTAYLHVRSATNNCYTYRVERA